MLRRSEEKKIPSEWITLSGLQTVPAWKGTLETLRYTTAGCYYTRQKTPFSLQTSNRLRFRCTATGCSASTCLFQKWICSTLFYFHIAKGWSVTMTSFSCVDLTSPRTSVDLEPPVIPTTKQNINTDKKLDFSTGRVFVECDKCENTKLSILIKYILNSSV